MTASVRIDDHLHIIRSMEKDAELAGIHVASISVDNYSPHPLHLTTSGDPEKTASQILAAAPEYRREDWRGLIYLIGSHGGSFYTGTAASEGGAS